MDNMEPVLKTQEKPIIRISVRNLVEFILRTGDLDNRRQSAPDNAMQEGGRIHRMIQKRMGSNYEAEVILKYIHETTMYDLSVEGRADGIITDIGVTEPIITIDEIKGTYKELSKIKEPVPVHLSQAMCYAFIFADSHKLANIRIRMTYCNIDTEEIRYFQESYSYFVLRNWFMDLMDSYRKWAEYDFIWKEKRQQSIKNLMFPFPYREGQKELVTYVYQTIYHKKKLFIEAPTGVGKTMSTVFPGIKAMGEGKVEKIFYLTAKTITRTVADEAFQLLRNKGLKVKTVILTAKEKMCFMEEVNCNPEACPYAKGHFDRINDAIFELLTNEDKFTREIIEEYAKRHQVCPFEMCLDMSLFSDAVICDYNYLFDPHVYLRRFFSEGIDKDYLFLVDEAHNLLDRGRDMYSAILKKEDFLALKKLVKTEDSKMEKQLEKCNKELLALKRECETLQIVEFIDSFVLSLTRLYATMDKFLEEHDDSSIKKEVLEVFFEISHFLDIYERVDDNYVMYTQMEEDGCFIIKLFCVNPSTNLRECMQRGRSTVLFSATLLPIQYYKKLLGGSEDDYEVYAQSVFDPQRKALFIGSDVTSKYSSRTEEQFINIAEYINKIINQRYGNYMVFFPSHNFLKQVETAFMDKFYDEDKMEILVQKERMSEKDRENFLSRFSGNEICNLNENISMDIEMDEERSLIGFCVMGGIFSEGIDLKNDSLIGAVIVGTGLPQVNNERELLRSYFDEKDGEGYNYAYQYPGMNKVLQAAGRVIRTAQDVGVVALLDQRFLNMSYQRMFPREWETFEVVTSDNIEKRVERFWNEWL